MNAGPPNEPAPVPVMPAATVMLLDDRPDLHVLVLTRRPGSSFVPGMIVFPGGGVDDEDADPAWADLVEGISDPTASAELGLDAGGLAYWVAAVRETWEETGVLLARGQAPDPDRLAGLRADVDAGRRRFLDVVVGEGWRLAGDELAGAARWITPPGLSRRYDTQFLVAAMPPGEEAVHDGVEAVDSAWMRPGDALAAWRRGDLAMLHPTICMLRVLDGYQRTQDVLNAARSTNPPGEQAVLAPHDGGIEVLLPGDPGYDEHLDRRVEGWVHLPRRP